MTPATIDFEEAKRILAAFAAEGVQYVLVGSMAMATHPALDVEYFVAPDPQRRAVARLRDGHPRHPARRGDSAIEDLEFEELLVDGVRHPRCRLRVHCSDMKRDSVRPQDRIDAQAIRERFGLREDDE